uniref:Uncharacterized protein n=1 Tax=Panagrolaimus sp. JU765 TaxID=591449 RepID=A0AC34Q047_9BILA
MKKSVIFYFFCLFFVVVESDVYLEENVLTKITVPTDELILHVEDKNINENPDKEENTLFCFAAKDLATKDDFCGDNQCSIRVKFYLLDGKKKAQVYYLTKSDTFDSDSIDIKINKTTIKGSYEKKDTQCSWDDHDGNYLLVKVTNISDRILYLKNSEYYDDDPADIPHSTTKSDKWNTPLHIPSQKLMDITIPKNNLVLFIANKQNNASKRNTIFCFKAKNMTDDDMICGNGFCGIRTFIHLDHKFQRAIYGNVVKQRRFVSNSSAITTFWINKTTITNSDFKETSSNCEWDDHGGKYLTVKLVEHENTKVYLMGSEFYRAPDPLTENYEYVECCEGANQHRYSLPNLLTYQNLELPLMIFLTETFLLLVLRIIYGILVIQKLRRKIIYVTPTLNFDDSYFDQD